MKRFRISCALMILGALFFCSCSKGVDMGKYIPKDAFFVVDVDMNQLWDKADLDNIDQISFVKLGRQELRSEDPQTAELVDAILKDPKTTGLNLKRDLAVYVRYSNDIDGAVVATMHSKKKFEEWLNQFVKDNEMAVNFEDREGWRVAVMENEVAVKNYVAFNNEVAMLLFSDANMDELLALKRDESLAGDKKFREYWKNRSEMSMWMGMEELMNIAEMSGQDVNGVMEIYGKEYWDAIKQASFAVNVIFDKGVMRMVLTVQGIDNKVFEKYMQKFNGDLVDYMPGKTYAALSAAYNLNVVMDALESDKELDINLDEEAMAGVTTRELISAFGGSMLFDLFDIDVNDEGSVIPMIAVAFDINNADVIRKVLESEDLGLAKVQDDVYSLEGLISFPVYICLSDRALFVSNLGEAIQTFREGKHKGAMEPVAKKVKAGNYLYVDLDINHYPDAVKALIPENITALMGKYLDYTEFVTNGTKSAEWDFYIKDRKQNSLLATLHFVDDNLVELGNLAGSIGGGSCPEVTDSLYVDEEWDWEYDD